MAELRRSPGLRFGREKKPEAVAPATDRRATLLEPVELPAGAPTLLEPEWPPVDASPGRRPGEAGRNVGMTPARPAGAPTQSVAPAAFGLGPALGLPVKPGGRGSSVPPSTTDLILTHPQKVKEEALRARAEAERHEALVRAIRGAIARGDRQQLAEAQEAIAMFGIDPRTVAPKSRLLQGYLDEQEKTLRDHDNKQRHDRLNLGERLENALDRRQQEIRSGNALAALDHARGFQGDTASIEAQIAKGEFVSPYSAQRWKNRFIADEYINTRNALALKNLAEAQAELARRPESPLLRKMDEAETAGDLFEVFIGNPLEIIALGLAQSAPDIAAGAAGSALAGPVGGIVINRALSYRSEFAAAIVAGFKSQGIDLQDKAAVLKAIENRKMMAEIYNNALTTAGIATMTDTASGGMSGIRLTGLSKRFVGQLIETGAQTVGQGLLGVGAEAATSLVLRGELPNSADLLRGFGEGAGGAALDKSVAGMRSAARTGATYAGSKIRPHYEAYRDRNTAATPPIDRNRDNARSANEAKRAQWAAGALTASIRRERQLQSASGDLQARKLEIDRSAIQQGTFSLSWEAADRLRKAGKLDHDLMMELGISRRWLDTKNAETPAAINRPALLASHHLKPEDVEAFVRELRASARCDVGTRCRRLSA